MTTTPNEPLQDPDVDPSGDPGQEPDGLPEWPPDQAPPDPTQVGETEAAEEPAGE